MSLFAPEPMLEVNLFVLDPDLAVVATVLARMEVLQLEEAQPEGWTPSPEWSALANRYARLVTRLEEIFDLLDYKPAIRGAPEGDLHPKEDWRMIEQRLAELEERTKPLQQQLEHAGKEIERLKLSESQVRVLLPLQVPVESLRNLRYQTVVVGTIPSENVTRVAEALFQIPFVLIPLQRHKDQTLLLGASSAENAAVLDRALKSAFFEPIPVPSEALGRPEQALDSLGRKAREIQGRFGALDHERQNMTAGLSNELNALWRRAATNRNLAEAIQRFPKHGEVSLISGWIAASDLSRVKKAVESAAGHPVAMEVLKADPKRQSVPSLVRIPGWLKPFEELVTTFGLSSYDELDPTLIVTISFFIMYGMMFGDLGHGLLLLLAGLLLARWRRDLGVLVTTAGASGMFFGFLYGTAFGQPTLRASWLRPLEGMWTILITAVAGGIVLLNIGFLLNFANAWRSKDWPRLLLEKNGLTGIALYWALLGGGLGVGYGVLPKSVLLLIPVLCALLWFHEPLAKWIWRRGSTPLGEAIVTGFFELFEAVTGYVSNSLSFIRLGAFAVAHEGLSDLVASYSKGRWGWVVMVLGTTLIVGFEGVIVGIQAIRLEYYEFFGRFFEGRGLPFAPFSLRTGGRHAGMGARA